MALIHHVVAKGGVPNGTPVVFVHGFACDHTDWRAQVAHLAPRHQTVAVDLRAHGGSPGNAADCSIERYGADVAAVMRALALPPAILVGHSMGCRVVIEAALQAPTQTAGIILVDGSQFAAAMEAVLRQRFATEEGYVAFIAGTFQEMFTARTEQSVARAIAERARALPRAIGQKMMTDLQRYDAGRFAASLASLRVPVMAVQTTFSNDQRERRTMQAGQATPYLDMLRAQLPSVRVEIIPDTGHFPQIDEPDRVNALIDDFIARLPAG